MPSRMGSLFVLATMLLSPSFASALVEFDPMTVKPRYRAPRRAPEASDSVKKLFKTKFIAKGEFTLGDGNDGLDTDNDAIRVTFGEFEQTIEPAEYEVKDNGKIKFKSRAINSLKVVSIKPKDAGYKYVVRATKLSIPSPRILTLSFGDDLGQIDLANGVQKSPVTATVKGQIVVLAANGTSLVGLGGATVIIGCPTGTCTAVTTGAGYFEVAANLGDQSLVLDGTSADPGPNGGLYPRLRHHAEIEAGTNDAGIFSLPELDQSNGVSIDAGVQAGSTTITSPVLSTGGTMSVTIPAGSFVTFPNSLPSPQIVSVSEVETSVEPMAFNAAFASPELVGSHPGGTTVTGPCADLKWTNPGGIPGVTAGEVVDIYGFDHLSNDWGLLGTGVVQPGATEIIAPGVLCEFVWHGRNCIPVTTTVIGNVTLDGTQVPGADVFLQGQTTKSFASADPAKNFAFPAVFNSATECRGGAVTLKATASKTVANGLLEGMSAAVGVTPGATETDIGVIPLTLTLFPCGNGTVEGTEACDDGVANSNTLPDACRTDCTLPSCGDGVVDPSKDEQCDDGNQTGGDGCEADCTICGDAVHAGAEGCDDGNTADGDGCSATCTVESGSGCTDGFSQSFTVGGLSHCVDGPPPTDPSGLLTPTALPPGNYEASWVSGCIEQSAGTFAPRFSVWTDGPGSAVQIAVSPGSGEAACLAGPHPNTAAFTIPSGATSYVGMMDDTVAPRCFDNGPSSVTFALSNARVSICTTLPTRVVFATESLQRGGLLGGLAGADAICNAQAAVGGSIVPPGPYKAWLSTGTVDAKDRIPNARYERPLDAALVATDINDLTDGSISNAISITQIGTTLVSPDIRTAFTGTSSAGTAVPERCNDWTSIAVNGQMGFAENTDAGWTDLGFQNSCNANRRIYCFEAPTTCGDGVAEGFEECDDGGLVDGDGCSAACLLERVIFQTSGAFTPGTDFVGLAGADALCQAIAEGAGLAAAGSPLYRAWLTGGGVTPPTRFLAETANAAGPFIRTDGTKIADDFADLIDQSVDNPVTHDENGAVVPLGTGTGACNSANAIESVWTGTFGDGTATGFDCNNWTSNSGGDFASVGDGIESTFRWTHSTCVDACNVAENLYCVQQD